MSSSVADRRPAVSGADEWFEHWQTGARPTQALTQLADVTETDLLAELGRLGVPQAGPGRDVHSLENRVFTYNGTGQSVVAKLYRPGSWKRAALEEEHRFLLELHREEIPVALPVPLPSGSTVGEWQGIYFALFEHFDGQDRTNRCLEDLEVERLGRLAAAVHRVGARRPAVDRRSMSPMDYLDGSGRFLRECDLLPRCAAVELAGRIEAIAAALERTSGDIEPHRLHGDLGLWSMLWTPDGPVLIDFDRIYECIIKPAVEELDIPCVRCDEIEQAGSIHHKMIEHIFDDEVAVVDITTLNPNVFYELGARHALRKNVTVLIRRRGTPSPFNIGGLNVIEYDPAEQMGSDEAKEKIVRFIEEGLRSTRSDSRIHDVLPGLRITHKSRRLPDGQKHVYRMTKVPGKEVCLITGDIRKIRGIDIWVNSENTNMQMARFHDRSISSIIRFRGAKKGITGQVQVDLIADELQSLLDSEGARSVPEGYVLPTTAGELRQLNDVKRVYHAAAVRGVPGHGYVSIPNVTDCVTRALELADAEAEAGESLKSILFQIMGTGAGGADPAAAGKTLLEAAMTHLELNPECAIDRVYFLITRARTLAVWQTVLAEFGDRVAQV